MRTRLTKAINSMGWWAIGKKNVIRGRVHRFQDLQKRYNIITNNFSHICSVQRLLSEQTICNQSIVISAWVNGDQAIQISFLLGKYNTFFTIFSHQLRHIPYLKIIFSCPSYTKLLFFISNPSDHSIFLSSQTIFFFAQHYKTIKLRDSRKDIRNPLSLDKIPYLHFFFHSFFEVVSFSLANVYVWNVIFFLFLLHFDR